MKLRNLATISLLLTTTLFSTPIKAEENQPIIQQTIPIQAPPTREEILNACRQNQADRLPNPYTDVEPTHWAYKAVLSMYYCGAFLQATPESVISNQ